MTSRASSLRVLTGITTTGTPHLGNYVGAIRPSIAASRDPGVDSFYFLADLHGLIKCPDPDRIRQSSLEIAASWLAAGLDPQRVHFYRQSDIPEIANLTWLLTCVTSKGLLNRAHAYKAQRDSNQAAQLDPDHEVTAGLFMYPVLMAADILIFSAHKVPVGRDQIQHLEITRDIAQRFNHLYGEHLTLPEVSIDEEVATLPGLDGRKMSKSYDNTIPLFSSREQLRRLIGSIVTDSRAPGEAKDTEGSALFQIFQAFASPAETAGFRQAFRDGIAWGDAKARLFERVDQELTPLRERYETLIADPSRIEETLLAGAVRARQIAVPFVARLKAAVGLRQLADGGLPVGGATAAGRAAGKSDAKADVKAVGEALAQFKQYREKDGRFYFKLVDGDGKVLLQSVGFVSARDAGQVVAALKTGAAALATQADHLQPVDPDAQALAAGALDRLAAD